MRMLVNDDICVLCSGHYKGVCWMLWMWAWMKCWWIIDNDLLRCNCIELYCVMLYYVSQEGETCQECEDVWLWDGQAEPV